MIEWIMVFAVLLPIFGGALFPFLPIKNRSAMRIYLETVAGVTSLMAFYLIWKQPAGSFVLFRFTGQLSISFHLDAVGSVFVALVSFLWPLALLYAFEYMEHENHRKIFYMFYLATYGVTLGIAMAEDIVTLYFFYEMLTMVTLPLILHSLSREAIHASRTYLYYSLGGAAFAFIGMIFILVYGSTTDFIPGGVLTPDILADKRNMLLLIYVICFCGFSVKAAMLPFSSWLPKAGVAPTPVTALLHAVAVVKAGAFANIRITYFLFGTDLIKGTWAQQVLLGLTTVTIVYGCSRAVKETHIKRRLAWSTVSNLSYILFGVALMSPIGLLGALCHMICHAAMKFCSFLCAGAVIHKSGKQYIHELDGLGYRMPRVFVIFTISSLALMGVPGLCGFVSKWYLAQAAVSQMTLFGYLGVGALLISALLTAIYMLSIVVRAFFPTREASVEQNAPITDPSWRMLLPLGICVVVMLLIGLHPAILTDVMKQVVMTAF